MGSAAGGKLRMLFPRKPCSRIVFPLIGQNGCSIGNNDIDGGRKRQNVYNDHGIADGQQMEQTLQTPFAPQVVLGLVEQHLIRLPETRAPQQILTIPNDPSAGALTMQP